MSTVTELTAELERNRLVIRELMLAVEYLRVCCEHTEGRTVKDREALSKGMCLGIDINSKHKNQIPDYQMKTFWADLKALPPTLGIKL
jgi:hypothetical protein